MMNNKMILENIPFGVILHNSDGLIIDANRHVERILKISLNEIIGKKWSSLSFKVVNKEGVECIIEKNLVTEVLTSGNDVKDQVVGIVHPSNKKVIWININTVFKPAMEGGIPEDNNALMYISDVTDIVKTNVAIENTVDNLNLGTWQWDIETGTLIFNEKWAGMLGYTIEELSSSKIDTWHKLIHPDDFKTMEDSLQAHFEGQSSEYYCEIRLHHKCGQWLWVRHIGKVTLWSDKGEPLYMSGMHQDISDFKKNELHLSRKIQYGKILSDISTNFINTHDIDTTIIESFSKIASLNQASRIYLFRFDEEKQTMSNTHEWCSEGVSPQIDILQDLPLTQFPWWIKKLSDGEIINISDVSKMPLEASAEKEILEYQSVKSIFVLPVIIKQLLVGFIGFDNVLSTENWSMDDIDLLSTTVSVFSYALDRQLSEKELNKSYLNLRSYFDLNSDYVIILNEQGEIVEVNNMVKEKLGYQNKDIIGKHVLMLHPYDVREKATQNFEALLENIISSFSLPILAKNGKKILVETTMTKGIWNDEPAFFSIGKDISEKVFSEEKFEKIFQNIPTIATLTDLATNEYTEVNSVFYEKLGFTINEVIGSNAAKLLGMEPNICSQLSSGFSEKGYLRDVETVIYHKDGTPISVLLSATSIYLLDKKYRLTLITDITETKKNEKQLIEAKLKAEESDRLKSAFLATMNHELRTPLNHIIGFSEMLPDMTENASIKEFSKLIHKSGLNLLNIIEDVFDLALMDQSEIRLREESVYVRDIYLALKKQLQESLSVSDKANDIQLEYKINSNAVTKKIITDKSKVMQVVCNLINNAIKFTHKGKISLDFVFESDNMLSILIKDTGVGIPDDKQGIIFEFFRQVDDSHTRIYEGIGIGLAISQKIANAMGGEICLKSEPGVGSEFKFTFPIKVHNDQLIDAEEDTTPSIVPFLLGKKILIVEDDVVGMEMIVNMLLPTQCEIVKAVNGYEGARIIVEDPTIDLVLMDLKMPVMDGFEATKFIRQELPQLPIIALTAYSMRKDKEKALGVGCNDIVTKPINKVMLLKKIEGLLMK